MLPERSLVAAFLFALSATLAFGAWRRWKWLVDPPTGGGWWLYSQSFIKGVFGASVTRYWTFGCALLLAVLGVAIILAG